jgi:nitrogen fixation protein FixH
VGTDGQSMTAWEMLGPFVLFAAVIAFVVVALVLLSRAFAARPQRGTATRPELRDDQ